ncbi:MAG: hypothetical protein NC915_00340 [Candidatus Omnitrophica bacterium]|nr:hypothetical protein [Candidatus Omnitrophota bacterium]
MLETKFIRIKNLEFKNLKLKLPENNFFCENLKLYNLNFENILCNFTDDLQGQIKFNFYEGKGIIDVKISDFSKFNGYFLIETIDINKLSSSFEKNIVITGFINLNGNFNIEKDKFEFETSFNSVPKRGIKQYMNFGAVEVIASLSGGSVIKQFGTSNFYYKTIAGRISLKDNYLTIEGLAGEKGDNQYLIIKPILFPGINILIDKKNNTIKFDEFINRVNLAIERIKQR